MVSKNIEAFETYDSFIIKVLCPKCKTKIELTYSDWEDPTKPYKKKRTCGCGHEWEIKITARSK